MEIVDTSTFFKWAAPYGIGLSIRYPESESLEHNRSPDSWARWTIQKDASAARILNAVIQLLGDWQFCWLYRKYGKWNCDSPSPDEPFFEILGHYLALKQIPRSFEGVLRLRKGETLDLLLFSFIQLLLPGSAATDVYLVSEDGKYIILLGHHDELVVRCGGSAILDELIRALHAKGFPVD